jgi:RNA polymerase sigma factor (sigma-70 family)
VDAGQPQFDRLIEPHLEVLYRAAMRLCRDEHDAEDLVHNVCLRAIDKLAGGADIASPRTWLLRVQYHLFIDEARRRLRIGQQSLDEPSVLAPASDEPGPEQRAATAMLSEEVDQAWRELERDQQALLALCAEGYTLSEMAEIAGVEVTALKSRLHRARRRLGKLIRSRHATTSASVYAGESS